MGRDQKTPALFIRACEKFSLFGAKGFPVFPRTFPVLTKQGICPQLADFGIDLGDLCPAMRRKSKFSL
jgi:hypothetical protein